MIDDSDTSFTKTNARPNSRPTRKRKSIVVIDSNDDSDSSVDLTDTHKPKKSKVQKTGNASENKRKVKKESMKLPLKTNKRILKASKNSSELIWNEAYRLAEFERIDISIARTLVSTFEEGTTIPFLARYRKNITDNMTAEQLRDAKNSYDEICALKKKAENVLQTIKKTEYYTTDIKNAIENCRSLEELEYIVRIFVVS